MFLRVSSNSSLLIVYLSFTDLEAHNFQAMKTMPKAVDQIIIKYKIRGMILLSFLSCHCLINQGSSGITGAACFCRCHSSFFVLFSTPYVPSQWGKLERETIHLPCLACQQRFAPLFLCSCPLSCIQYMHAGVCTHTPPCSYN